jgi:hypothetical protein
MHAGRSNWPKIVGLAPDDMSTPFIGNSSKNIFSSKQPRLPAGTTPALNLPCFTREIVCFFISAFSFYFLGFYE